MDTVNRVGSRLSTRLVVVVVVVVVVVSRFLMTVNGAARQLDANFNPRASRPRQSLARIISQSPPNGRLAVGADVAVVAVSIPEDATHKRWAQVRLFRARIPLFQRPPRPLPGGAHKRPEPRHLRKKHGRGRREDRMREADRRAERGPGIVRAGTHTRARGHPTRRGGATGPDACRPFLLAATEGDLFIA